MKSVIRSVFAIVAIASVLFTAQVGFAASAGKGLIIHTAEFGVGKFHRYDNKVHAYGASNAWLPFVLADGAPVDRNLVQKNADGSYTIFFLTLADMIELVQKLSQETKQQVSVLNLHGHGLPGRMWFPKDVRTMESWSCYSWKEAASGSDKANYEQYYSPLSVSQINQIRDISNNPNIEMGCTTGLKEWREAMAANPGFKAALADDIQIHFLSCVVGLGKVGETFTQGMAELLLPTAAARLETSVNFGLGDWSMDKGMGFWDFITEDQVKRDGDLYQAHRRDSEIAQKGTMRIANYAGAWKTGLVTGRDVMAIGFETAFKGTLLAAPIELEAPTYGPAPARIRVPGTNSFVDVREN